jgi:hypothetical protein
MSSRRASSPWTALLALGSLATFVVTLMLSLNDLEHAASARPAAFINSDRHQVIGSLALHGVGTAVGIWLARTKLAELGPFSIWRRTNVIAGAVALVGMGAVLPFACLAAYYDNLDLLASPAAGVPALAGLALGVLWMASEVARVAVAYGWRDRAQAAVTRIMDA